MQPRARPDDDIAPLEFFTCWLPRAVSSDAERRSRLGDTDGVLEFELTGEGGGFYTLEVVQGEVRGRAGPASEANLRVRVDVASWRALNRGDLSAPEALLRRRVHLSGNFLLALKLHLILG